MVCSTQKGVKWQGNVVSTAAVVKKLAWTVQQLVRVHAVPSLESIARWRIWRIGIYYPLLSTKTSVSRFFIRSTLFSIVDRRWLGEIHPDLGRNIL
eukprot:scaffold31414_cov183-Amphora_coffeaeformis.AAC.5